MRRVLLLLLTASAVASWSASARAGPQGHGALSAGVCALDRGADGSEFPCFSGAVRGELLFGRERDRDLGFGPMASLSTASFDHYGASLGLSVLLPVSPTFPFVVSLAGGALSKRPGWSPAVEAWLFWGPSSYNFHSRYAMASGVLLGYQTSLGSERITVLSLTGQVDLALISLPFILAHQWIAGGP